MSTESIYWNAMDFDSEAESTNQSSSPRNYVDPWDLENYAYIQKRYDVPESIYSPSAAGEPLEASFYYTPFDGISRADHYDTYGISEEPSKYAGIDEYDFRNGYFEQSKYYDPYYRGDEIYGTTVDFSDMDQASGSDDPLVTDGSLLYMYETSNRYRKMAVPSSINDYSAYRMSYRNSYEDYHPKPRMEEIYYSPRQVTVPIYDDLKMNRPKPGNFGLSNYGHLKIDYSFSWDSLGQYIGK